MQKSIKSLKRNGILLLAYDLLVLCIVFVKNGMINMSAEAATSLIVSIGFGIFINLLWIVDSKTWITDYGKRKCIWSYWCGEIVLLLLVVALENMNQLVATSAILGMMAVYLIIGIWWVSRFLSLRPDQKYLSYKIRLIQFLYTKSVTQAGHGLRKDGSCKIFFRPQHGTSGIIADTEDVRIHILGMKGIHDEFFVSPV